MSSIKRKLFCNDAIDGCMYWFPDTAVRSVLRMVRDPLLWMANKQIGACDFRVVSLLVY